MRPRGSRQQTRPSLWADEHLEPDERAHLGDRIAMDVAHERHLEATHRYRAPEVDPEVDLVDERPDDLDEARTDEVAVEVQTWRAAVLDGQPLAFRDEVTRRSARKQRS